MVGPRTTICQMRSSGVHEDRLRIMVARLKASEMQSPWIARLRMLLLIRNNRVRGVSAGQIQMGHLSGSMNTIKQRAKAPPALFLFCFVFGLFLLSFPLPYTYINTYNAIHHIGHAWMLRRNLSNVSRINSHRHRIGNCVKRLKIIYACVF